MIKNIISKLNTDWRDILSSDKTVEMLDKIDKSLSIEEDTYGESLEIFPPKELIFNAGFENLSIINIAKIISKLIKSKIVIVKDKKDPRSYRMNSDKLKTINFSPKKNISIAALELRNKFKQKKLSNNLRFYSVKWLKHYLKKNETKLFT